MADYHSALLTLLSFCRRCLRIAFLYAAGFFVTGIVVSGTFGHPSLSHLGSIYPRSSFDKWMSRETGAS